LEWVHQGFCPDADGIPSVARGTLSVRFLIAVESRWLMVAKSVDCRLLGLDLEKTNRLSAGAIKQVLHPIEETFAGGDQLKASILFSLKEAFYKAQFPKWRAVGNFSDLALEVDLAKGSARIREMDARFSPELMRLKFCFRIVDDYVVSLSWM
jgi:4'-phosphopantetheinyl transferase EntD